MKQALLKQDTVDIHDVGCECALCDANGKSYGVGVYIVPANTPLSNEDELDQFYLSSEANYRTYGVTEEAAFQMAQTLCEHEGISILNDEVDNMEKVYGPEVVDCVNFKLDTDNFLAFEFETTEDIFVDQAQSTFSLFRLNFNKKDQSIDVYVAYSEDYDLCEYVSYLFDGDALLAHFIELDDTEDIEDHTEEYFEYYENDYDNEDSDEVKIQTYTYNDVTWVKVWVFYDKPYTDRSLIPYDPKEEPRKGWMRLDEYQSNETISFLYKTLEDMKEGNTL